MLWVTTMCSGRTWSGVSLLLRTERSHLRWSGHLIRMPPGRHSVEGFPAHLTWRRQQSTGVRWRGGGGANISQIPWENMAGLKDAGTSQPICPETVIEEEHRGFTTDAAPHLLTFLPQQNAWSVFVGLLC